MVCLTHKTPDTLDAGYHSEANLQELHDTGVPALIADGLMRRRDERFAEQARYKALPDPLYDKTAASKPVSAKFQKISMPPRLTRHRSFKNQLFIQLR